MLMSQSSPVHPGSQTHSYLDKEALGSGRGSLDFICDSPEELVDAHASDAGIVCTEVDLCLTTLAGESVWTRAGKVVHLRWAGTSTRANKLKMPFHQLYFYLTASLACHA